MIKKTDVVYISGPMTGYPECNYPAFNAMEEKLVKKFGCKVLNPAKNFNGDATRKRHEYFRCDFQNVLAATAVVYLKGWTGSEGAWSEYMMARQLALKMYDTTFKKLKQPERIEYSFTRK